MVGPTDTVLTNEPFDHFILKGGYYYRANKQGYTKEPTAAGRYTKSVAEREARIEPWHMRAVPVSEVLPENGKELDLLEELERCRNIHSYEHPPYNWPYKTFAQAKEEIERLRAEVAYLQNNAPLNS